MYVKRLQLKNFRNYPDLDLEFAPQHNVLWGDNAQGKTNILEAIYLMSCARSHRTAKDKELIQQGQEFYQIDLDYVRSNGAEESLTLRYESEFYGQTVGDSALADIFPQQALKGKAQRKISSQGLALERLQDLFGRFLAVIFAPEDLMLIKKGPGERRRFLDILISQLSPSYFRQLQVYQKLLKQRNHILKDIRDKEKGRLSPETRQMLRLNLDIWDQQLAESGAFIICKRQEILEELTRAAQEAMQTLSASQESIQLNYQKPSQIDLSQGLEGVQAAIQDRLAQIREDEIFRGYSSYGPHRDDIEMVLNGLSAQNYASQGQQRSLVLSLKVAELAVLEKHCEEKPVLLLDDVMSELDQDRRTRLFDLVSDKQVFLTCTDLDQVAQDLLAQKPDNAVYQVKAGQVSRS